jgi:hypothetical protein
MRELLKEFGQFIMLKSFLNLSSDIKKNIEISENLMKLILVLYYRRIYLMEKIEFTSIKLITEVKLITNFFLFKLHYQKVYQKAFLKILIQLKFIFY